MRFITIPFTISVQIAPTSTDKNGVALTDLRGNPVPLKIPISFQKILNEIWLIDNKFGKTVSSIRRGISIGDAFANAQEGSTVPLDEEDWKLLCEIVDEPSAGYNTVIARSAIKFIDAVICAPNKAPAHTDQLTEPNPS